MIAAIRKSINDLVLLIFPELCVSCQHLPPIKEDVMCLYCKSQVAESEDYLFLENNFTKHFWGKVDIYTGSALYYYSKGGKVQAAIQKLKYKKKKHIGESFGKSLGEKLKASKHYSGINLIIPVPLHIKKQKRRGYNQSDCFAKGLSQALDIPWSNQFLKRHLHTDTQTNKSRSDRIINVEKAFMTLNSYQLQDKHILLVDDVLTTGATLEACAIELLKIPGVQVSCATIAMGSIV